MNSPPFAVIPVLVGPLQVLLALLPAILLSLGGLIFGLLRPRVLWAGIRLLWRQKAAVAVIVGIFTVAIFMLRSFASSGTTSEQVSGTEWPMFRADATRRGSEGSDAPPCDGGLVWSFTDVKTFFSSPAVVGNRVYVSSADKGPLRDRGAIYCLDADTGGLVWKAAPKGYAATFSSPSVAGHFLVCGEGLHYTQNARVFCMDLVRQEVLWTYTTNGHVESTPCIDKGRVYVGAGDDGYYCFRLEPDTDGHAVVLWHVPGERCPDADTSPVVHDGRLVVGCGMHGNAICCLDADTGEQLWRVTTPFPVFASPTLVGGRVLVGMGNGNYIESAEEVKRKELDYLRKQGKTAEKLAAAEKTLGAAGAVWCLEEKTGRVEWKFVTGDIVLGTIAASEDRIFFASRDGYVYAVSMEGKESGRWDTHAPIVASPALSGGLLYVVTETGKLYGLRADDMELAWETTLGFTGPFLSSPAVARGHVYVGSQQDGLLCVGKSRARKQDLCWAGSLGGPGCGGSIDNQPLPEKGKFAWRYPKTNDANPLPDVQCNAPLACLSGSLYLPLHGGRNGLVCLREDDKQRNEPRERWFAPSANGVWLSPAARPEEVFFVDGRKNQAARRLNCVAAADGTPRWSLPVADDASGEFLLLDQGGLIADGPRHLTCFRENGEIVWRNDCGTVFGVPSVTDALLVVTTDEPPALLVLDRPSGATLWRVLLDAVPTAAPVVRKNTIYFGTKLGVSASRLVDGKPIWRSQGGPPSTPLVLAKNRLAYVSARGELVVIGLEDGRVEKALSSACAGIAPLAAPGVFVYATKKGLMSYSMDSEPRLWTNTDWLGELSTSPVMANSRIYFTTVKKGLICANAREAVR